MSITTRKLTIDDLPEMIRVFSSQDNLLKVKKTKHIHLHYVKLLPFYVDSNPTMSAFGVFDGERMVAFSTYNEWAVVPYWTLGLFYTDSDYLTSVHSIDTIGVLKTVITNYAESKGMYTAFSIATINALGMRAWQQDSLKGESNQMWDGNTARYNITVEEVIPPFSYSKHFSYGQALGIIEGLNSVPLVVTKWTLSNKFRNYRISEKHVKRLNKLSNA